MMHYYKLVCESTTKKKLLFTEEVEKELREVINKGLRDKKVREVKIIFELMITPIPFFYLAIPKVVILKFGLFKLKTFEAKQFEIKPYYVFVFDEEKNVTT